jgi:hypothetical protein
VAKALKLLGGYRNSSIFVAEIQGRKKEKFYGFDTRSSGSTLNSTILSPSPPISVTVICPGTLPDFFCRSYFRMSFFRRWTPAINVVKLCFLGKKSNWLEHLSLADLYSLV